MTNNLINNNGVIEVALSTTEELPSDVEFFQQKEDHDAPKETTDDHKAAKHATELFIEVFFVKKEGGRVLNDTVWYLYEGNYFPLCAERCVYF